jgi:hypothetical protein
MPDYLLPEEVNERYASLLREADAVRRVLRSRQVVKASPLLKTLIIFLVSLV